MKYLGVVCLILCVANAFSAAIPTEQQQQQQPREIIPILRSASSGPEPSGAYSYSYETGNGIQMEEQGELKPEGEQGTMSVRGRYSYQADDGTPIEVVYTADENGFQPQGAHLPKAPEIPEGILRALAWIAEHPEEDNLQ
ncbi:hypothetical protein TKK_0000906 [Trichogramma kaykai]